MRSGYCRQTLTAPSVDVMHRPVQNASNQTRQSSAAVFFPQIPSSDAYLRLRLGHNSRAYVFSQLSSSRQQINDGFCRDIGVLVASYRRHGPMQVTGPHSARQTPSAKSMNRSAAHQSRPFTPVAPNCSQQACRITGPPTAKLPLCSCPKSASPPVCLCLCLYTPLPLQRPSPPSAAFPRFLLGFLNCYLILRSACTLPPPALR